MVKFRKLFQLVQETLAFILNLRDAVREGKLLEQQRLLNSKSAAPVTKLPLSGTFTFDYAELTGRLVEEKRKAGLRLPSDVYLLVPTEDKGTACTQTSYSQDQI